MTSDHPIEGSAEPAAGQGSGIGAEPPSDGPPAADEAAIVSAQQLAEDVGDILCFYNIRTPKAWARLLARVVPELSTLLRHPNLVRLLRRLARRETFEGLSEADSVELRDSLQLIKTRLCAPRPDDRMCARTAR